MRARWGTSRNLVFDSHPNDEILQLTTNCFLKTNTYPENLDRFQLDLELQPQPNDTTCGPTCLQAIYHYYGDTVGLDQLTHHIPELENGGTLAVHLGLHALQRGYQARIWTFNLRIFDPTWFHHGVPKAGLDDRLKHQEEYREDPKRRMAAAAYLAFHLNKGDIRFGVLNGKLIRSILRAQYPLIVGLSSTFLYNACREMPDTNKDDDLNGDPCGHFVVLCGYDKQSRQVKVADPYHDNPLSRAGYYQVDLDRLINAILLGVLTYDGNLLQIYPK